MFRTMRELNAPPKIELPSDSSYQRGSPRLIARLPMAMDDWMLFGRWMKYTCRPVVAGGGANAGFAPSPFAHPPNPFSPPPSIAFGAPPPTLLNNALLGRCGVRWDAARLFQSI